MSKGNENVLDQVIDVEYKSIADSLNEALNEAYKIVDSKLNELTQKLEEIRKDYESKAASTRERILSAAELESRSAYLKTFNELSEKAMKEALSRLASLPRDNEYEKLLEKLLIEAIDVVGSGEVTVIPAKRDVELVKKLVKKLSRRKTFSVKLRVSEEVVDSAGGLIVRSSDGSVSYANTFEARLARKTDEIKKLLFDWITG